MKKILIVVTALLLLAPTRPAAAADYWTSADNPGVATNNDCGVVSALSGAPRIRRAFMSERDQALPAGLADRLHAGDVVEVPEDGRLEWTTGHNVVVVAGPGSRVRLEGLRNFAAPDGSRVARLDARLLKGEMRLQVRLNQERPEAALVALEGSDALLERGDLALSAGGGWFCATLGGEALARLKRGGSVGAPFAVAEMATIGLQGEGKLDNAAASGLRARLPFSFELMTAALPPLPALGAGTEALGP